MTAANAFNALADVDTGATLQYTTRYGDIHLREDRLISFPQGLFGFNHCTVFGLTKIPNLDESPILLLQCVNEPEVSFMVAAPELLGLEIAAADRKQALKDTNMPENLTQFVLILTLYDHGEGYYITANLRAPVLIDSERRIAKQYIMSNKTYSTQAQV